MLLKKIGSLVGRLRFRPIQLVAAGKTDVGRVRSNNEDCYAVYQDDGLFIVCDGMGGHAGGELASRVATETVLEQISGGQSLEEAINMAHIAVSRIEVPDEFGARPGSTIAVLRVQKGEWQIGWVGDSRIWLEHKGMIKQLTVDHTVVQQMVNWGDLTPEEALIHPERNRLSQALGTVDAQLLIGLKSGRLEQGMRFLLATDGLVFWDEPVKLAGVLTSFRPDVAVERLIEESLEVGGHDNVSCIVVECQK